MVLRTSLIVFIVFAINTSDYDFTDRKKLVDKLDTSFSQTQERIVEALAGKSLAYNDVVSTVKSKVEESLKLDWNYREVDLHTHWAHSIVCLFLRKLLTREDFKKYCPDQS